MADDAVSYLPCQVQPASLVFQLLHHPEALLVMPEAAVVKLVQHLLADVPERCVAKVVPKGYAFRQVFVQVERPGQRTGYLGDLQCVAQACNEMVALRGDEDLRLVLQPAESLGIEKAVRIGQGSSGCSRPFDSLLFTA